MDTLVITRIFAAAQEDLWEAWTDCDHVKRWWGPEGFTAPYCQIGLDSVV
jgi:uncharacterized protein YndB with AHSA1/START domain